MATRHGLRDGNVEGMQRGSAAVPFDGGCFRKPLSPIQALNIQLAQKTR